MLAAQSFAIPPTGRLLRAALRARPYERAAL